MGETGLSTSKFVAVDAKCTYTIRLHRDGAHLAKVGTCMCGSVENIT